MAKSNVTGEVIKLKNVRLSFPVIWRPKAFEEGKDPKYQATFLLDPSDKEHAKQIKAIKKSFVDVCKAAFGDHKGVSRCFGLADKHQKKREYDGYKGMFWLATGNTNRPTLVDRHRQDLEESDGVLYAGCYVNTNVTLWTYDHPRGGKGVGANLRIIQFVKDGEAFGNAPVKAEDELDDIEIEDGEADDDWDDEDDLD